MSTWWWGQTWSRREAERLQVCMSLQFYSAQSCRHLMMRRRTGEARWLSWMLLAGVLIHDILNLMVWIINCMRMIVTNIRSWRQLFLQQKWKRRILSLQIASCCSWPFLFDWRESFWAILLTWNREVLEV